MTTQDAVGGAVNGVIQILRMVPISEIEPPPDRVIDGDKVRKFSAVLDQLPPSPAMTLKPDAPYRYRLLSGFYRYIAHLRAGRTTMQLLLLT
jgi:uncharacterized ParB-like nuclease family protein